MVVLKPAVPHPCSFLDQGIEVAVTKGRQGNGNGGPWDGHWGVRLGARPTAICCALIVRHAWRSPDPCRQCQPDM